MTVNSTASISLNLSVTGDKEWEGIKTTLAALKKQMDALGKGAASKLQLTQQVEALGKELTNVKGQLERALGAIEKMGQEEGEATAKTKALGSALGTTTKQTGQLTIVRQGAAKVTREQAKYEAELTQRINEYLKFSPKVTKEILAQVRARVADEMEMERQNRLIGEQKLAQKAAAVAAIGAMRSQIGVEKEQRTALQGLVDKIKELSKNKTWWNSTQAAGIRAVSGEILKLNGGLTKTVAEAIRMGKTLDANKMKQFKQAIDGAANSMKRWATDLGKFAGRLTFFEQQMDAILRASYRFKAAGADLTRFAQNIQRGFQTLMTTFGEFDFNIRRAAGSLGAFEGYTGGISKALGDLAAGAMDAAREIKFIPIDEVAKGFYFWGSMTGAVVKNLRDVNALVEEHTAVLKAASMTEVGFETALKGVYSVLTQFYNGNLAYTVDVTEKLFYVTQKTSAEFADLLNSFKMVGPVAKGLGVSFDDILTTLGELADLGMRGTMAGRAIRQIFIQAVKPSKQASKALQNSFAAFMDTGFEGMDEVVKKNLSSVLVDGVNSTYDLLKNSGGSYYEAIFPQGEYAGIQNQIKVLAAMTMNMTGVQRDNLLGVMSTANSLPVLMALVGREIRTLQTDIAQQSKLNLDDAKKYFEKNWDLLSQSWKGVTGALQRSWESLKVTIGTTVAKVLTPLFEKLTGIVDKLTEWAHANPAIIAALSKFAALAAVFAAIAGAVLTVTGSVLGLGAVAYVAFNSFFFPITRAGKALDVLAEKFPKVGSAAKGLQTGFLGVFGVIIALIQSVVKNFDYISERVGHLGDAIKGAFGGVGDTIGNLASVLNSFNQGVQLVFDQIVRRVADFIALIGDIIDIIGDASRTFNNAFPAIGSLLGNVIDLGAKFLGILVALGAAGRLLALVASFGLVKKVIDAASLAVTAFKIRVYESQLAAAKLSVVPGTLSKIKFGFEAAGTAAKGFMASTGVGLLLIGLSLLVEWLGTSQRSLDDLKEATKASASAFGDWADDAEAAARNVAETMTAMPMKEVMHPAAIPSTEGLSGAALSGVLASSVVRATTTMEADYAAYQKVIETKTQEIIEKWKGLVASTNAKIEATGVDYQISLEGFMRVYTSLRASAAPDLEDAIMDQLAADISSIDIGADDETLKRALIGLTAKYKQLGVDIGLTFEELRTTATTEAARHIAEQGRNDDILTKMIDSLHLSPESNMSDWLALIKQEVTLTDGQRMTIQDALAGDMFSADGLKQIWDGVMQGAGEAAEKLAAQNEIPQAVIGQMATALKEGFIALQYGAIEEAMPGMNEAITKIAEASGLGDLGKVMSLITTETVADGFGTIADMLKAGTLPDDVEKGILDYVKLAAEQNMPGAQALLDSLKEGLDGSFSEAAQKWMTDIKDAFLSAVDAGINKSLKDVISGLRKRLNNPGKYSDAASVSKLLGLLGNETLLYAMAQSSDSLARKQAFDAYNNSVVQPTLGGIELAIENGHPEQAQEDLRKFIKKMVVVPDYYWDNLDPDAAQNMLDFLKANYAGDLPPDLFAGLTSAIERGATEAIANVTPPEITYQQLFKFGGTGNDEDGRGATAPTALVNAVVPDATAAAVQAALTTAVTTAVGAVLPGVPGMSAPVGTAVVNGIIAAIQAAVAALVTQLNTVVNLFDDGVSRAYDGGYSIGSAFSRGLEAGLSKAIQNTNHKLEFLADKLGRSLPKLPPLNHPDSGGKSIGDAWAGALDKSLGKAKDKVGKHLKQLRHQLSGAKGTLARLIGLNNPNDYGYYEKEIRRQRGVVARAQAALDRYLSGNHGSGDGGGKGGGKTGGHTGKNDDPLGVNNFKAKIAGWLATIRKYRGQITDLFLGGLTEEEKRRKTYLEELIGDLQYKIDHVKKGSGKGNHGSGKNDGPSVGDTRGDAVVTDVTKRIIEIHVDVESKDGSVNRAQQASVRKGIMDALVLADMEHFVTVG